MAPLFELVRYEATDGTELCGFLSGGRKKRCVIYLHGLGSNGYRSRMIPALAEASEKKRCGFFSINTRGHDVHGSTTEIFAETLHDIRGAIRFLKSRGVRTVFLVGHSTGANKIAYFLQRRIQIRGVRIKSAVYLAPGDDIGIQKKLLGPKQYRKMQKLAAGLRRNHPDKIMPVKNLNYLPSTSASYHSLFGMKNRMDQFPFRSLFPSVKWKRLTRTKIPAAILLGAEDEFLPASPKAIRDFFAKHYPQIPVLSVPGANHSFQGKEKQMGNQALGGLLQLFEY